MEMAHILRLRARRFRALHAFLTGAAQPELPADFHSLDRAGAEGGMRELRQADCICRPLAMFRVAPCKR